jgi:hypothetical protein
MYDCKSGALTQSLERGKGGSSGLHEVTTVN